MLRRGFPSCEDRFSGEQGEERYADGQGSKGETQAKEGATWLGDSLMPSGTSCRLEADDDNCDTCLRHVDKL